MLSSRGFQSIFIIIFIVGATAGQMRQHRQQQQQQQIRDHYEFAPVHLASQFQDYSQFPFAHSSLPNEQQQQQYAIFQKPTHQIQHFQTGNGNSLAATEIAMEILGDIFPSNIENPDDINEYYQYYERRPTKQKDSLDFLEKQHNIRRTNTAADAAVAALTPTAQQLRIHEKRQDKVISKNANWHENAFSYGDDDNNNYVDDIPLINNEWLATRMNNIVVPLFDINNEAGEYESNVNALKSSSHDVNVVNGIPCLITVRPDNGEKVDKENFWQKTLAKRNPLAIGDHGNIFAHPHYPFTFFNKGARGAGDKRNTAINHVISRNNKRERIHPQRTAFIPSVSTGSMTHLGHFFGDLSKNVRFNERNQFLKPQEKLLQGDHPLGIPQDDVDGEPDEETKIEKTAELLQAIRSYRPSQKIRSLVSMNPQGYHGSNFLDPNYMWVGLG